MAAPDQASPDQASPDQASPDQASRDPATRAAAAAPAPSGRRPGRRRGRWVAAGLAAVVVVAAALAAVLHFTRVLVPSHAVPSLIGANQAAAAAQLRPLHLRLQVAGSVYDAHARAGAVINQHPATGRLREGGTVVVTLSRGPQPVAVPDVRGLTAADATALLQRLGLRAAVARRSSMTVVAGAVISSAPAQGTLLPGQTVQLVVSSGKPTVAVPALTGAPLAAARSTLAAAGLGVSEQDQYNDNVPRGAVIATLPSAGTAATVGSDVTVVVSLGPHLVAVPDVAGDSVGAASEKLGAVGFQISGVTGNPIATVNSTSPGAGTLAHYGAAIQIVTG
jgi:serine/threonine-protein kinase